MVSMIQVNDTNVSELGRVHSVAWQSSHKGIVTDEFLYSFTPERQTNFFIEEITHTSKLFYLAYVDNNPIGMISLNLSPENENQDVGEVISLYIIPEYQRRGFGSEIMNFAINSLKYHEKKSIFLWVMNVNVKARKFYENYGYKYSGIEKDLNFEKGLTVLKYTFDIE